MRTKYEAKLSTSLPCWVLLLFSKYCPFIMHFGAQDFLMLPLSYKRRKIVTFTIGWSAEPTLQQSVSAHCTWRNPKALCTQTQVCIGRVNVSNTLHAPRLSSIAGAQSVQKRMQQAFPRTSWRHFPKYSTCRAYISSYRTHKSWRHLKYGHRVLGSKLPTFVWADYGYQSLERNLALFTKFISCTAKSRG